MLQVYIAQEETKFGLDEGELEELLNTNGNELQEIKYVKICGMMGMASFSDDKQKVRAEFRYLKSLMDKFRDSHSAINILSMGMSADYEIAMEEGSNMVRIGSLLFGERS